MDEKETENSSESTDDQPKTGPVNKTRDRQNSQQESALAERVADLEEAVKTEKNRSDDLLRRLQYLQADFENYRRRVEKEVGDVRRFGNERLISDILVVKDELELAYAKAQESKQSPVIADGVGMILRRLQTLLTKEGVERIPGVGSKFNPDYHEAALKIPSDKEEGTIVEEVRPGYLLKGRILRASIVKVAEKTPSGETDNHEEPKE